MTNNGYVGVTNNYGWSSNLPGAYRDTRASDGSTSLDFTVGTAYKWLLKPGTTYRIRTTVPSGSRATASRARLTGSLLRNEAVCKFKVDPETAQVVQGSPNPWCFGLTGSSGNASYIRIPDFAIRYTGTCRNWIYAQGATSC